MSMPSPEMETFISVGGKTLAPLESLRLYCSLTMGGTHWVEVEELFDRVEMEAPASIELGLYKQQVLHDPENGMYGDCLQTAIACVLGIDPKYVPCLNYSGLTGDSQKEKAEEFLNGIGYRTIVMPIAGTSAQMVMDWVGQNNPGAIYLLTGMAARGVEHVVVCKGNGFFHDPHPDNSFLTGPCRENTFWVEFIVPKVDYK